METTPTAAIPSSTFSVSLVNAVLGMFLESCASIEEIANDNSLSIPVVMQCLDEQKPFLFAMLSTLELRVRLLAARAEAVAIESLREIAYIGRDPEARRKAASKLLSHFAQRTRRASVEPQASAHSPAGTCSTTVRECVQDSARATNVAGSAASLVQPQMQSNTQAAHAAATSLHADALAISEPGA